MSVYILGDLHGEFNLLNRFINKKNDCDIILQCGDFGYWPNLGNHNDNTPQPYASGGGLRYKKSYSVSDIKAQNTKIHWCPGNHEDYWALQYIGKDTEVAPNVFYQPRGSVITLPDGRNVLFMGGAYSIDKHSRTLGIDWFPEETIGYKDIDNLPDCHIDIVISHTCPESFLYGVIRGAMSKANDPSCQALEYILEKYRPSRFIFGHWHKFNEGHKNGCHWTCLNIMGDTGGWIKLP